MEEDKRTLFRVGEGKKKILEVQWREWNFI